MSIQLQPTELADPAQPPVWRSECATRPGESLFSLRGILSGLLRRRLLLALNVLAWCLITWACLVFWPRGYYSEAKLLLRVGRESVGLDPTATTGETLLLQKSQEDEINSAVEILNSRQIAERVVDTIGVAAILDDSAEPKLESASADPPSWYSQLSSDSSDALHRMLIASKIRDPLSDREEAVRKVDRQRQVAARRHSTIITVTATGSSPESAQRLASVMTDVFLDEHAQASRTKGSHGFFEDQTRLLDRELTAKLQELREFKQEHLLVSADARRDILKQQLAENSSEILRMANELEFSQAKLKDLEEKLAAAPEQLVTQRLQTGDDAYNRMRELLYSLEIQERELASTHKPTHPAYIAAKQQREEVQQILAGQGVQRYDTTEALNPNRLSLELIEKTEGANLVAQQARYSELLRQRDTLGAEIKQFAEQEIELARLQREADLLAASFGKHAEKREEARINDALQSDQISNVNIVQPASFVEKPVSPTKIVFVAMGGFLAIATSLGFATFAEAIDSTIRTDDQAEAVLGLPVLASLRKRRSRRPPLRPKDRAQYEMLSDELLERANVADRRRSLGLLGCHSGAGASTVAAHLATVAGSRLGRPSLLVDADFERRSVSRLFGLNGAPGLLETLQQDSDAQELILKGQAENLEFLLAGDAKSDAVRLEPRALAARVNGLADHYDTVFVDLPAADSKGRGADLAKGVDGVLLVIEAERTTVEQAQRVKQRLQCGGTVIVGVILNKSKRYLPAWLNRLV